jgi:hypothetical protein
MATDEQDGLLQQLRRQVHDARAMLRERYKRAMASSTDGARVACLRAELALVYWEDAVAAVR